MLLGTVKTVDNNTISFTVLCCHNQVVVVTSTFCTETSETVPYMCVVKERESDGVSSDFVRKFDCKHLKAQCVVNFC
jgi:hypothetical protein